MLRNKLSWIFVMLILLFSILVSAEEPIAPKNIMKLRLTLSIEGIALDDVWVEYNKDKISFFMEYDAIYDMQQISCNPVYYYEIVSESQKAYNGYVCAPSYMINNEYEIEITLPYLDEYDEIQFYNVQGKSLLTIPLYNYKKSKIEKTEELPATTSNIDVIPEDTYDEVYESEPIAAVEEQPLLTNDLLIILGSSLAFVIVLAVFIMMVKGKNPPPQYQQKTYQQQYYQQ